MVAITPNEEIAHNARVERMRQADAAVKDPDPASRIDIRTEAKNILGLVRQETLRIRATNNMNHLVAPLIAEAGELEAMFARSQKNNTLYVIADRGRALHGKLSGVLAKHILAP